MLHTVLFTLGIGRVLLGLAPFLLAQPSARLLGFPREHDTPTTRLMARMFGVRDVGLGVLVFYALHHPPLLPFVALLNATMDMGDLAAIAIPLVRRQGIDRAAWTSLGFALFASATWLTMVSQLS